MSPPSNYLKQADQADIGLVLEGTFPYVSGGVSSWVNQMIRAFPEYRFAAIFLGSHPDDYSTLNYDLPENLVHLEVHYLQEPQNTTNNHADHAPPLRADIIDKIRTSHLALKHSSSDHLPQAMDWLLKGVQPKGAIPYHSFLHSEGAWELVTEMYQQFCHDRSFIDYFWTWRIMHSPLWRLASIASQFIPIRCIHTISTGYAGLVAAMLKNHQHRPVILSEHGIYTKERKIDLFQAEWIHNSRNPFDGEIADISHFKEMWIRFFETLGKICYAAADPIIALYENNRLRQIADGADASRTRNIPNGVDIPRLAKLRQKRPLALPKTICLLGRVVPIKDVKTFIRAMRIMVSHDPSIMGWIAGPTDEDPAYYQECLDLTESLNLQKKLRFLGLQKIEELLPQVGVLVLSSISEALPLVLLEGFAAGVPCVATDVGSCRQLVEGLTEEDQLLGLSGRIVGIADPQGLAKATLTLLEPEAWYSAQKAAIARVERYYALETMLDAYRAIYQSALLSETAHPSPLSNDSF